MNKLSIKSVLNSLSFKLVVCLLLIANIVNAQPGYLYGNLGLGWSHYQLQDRGGVKALTAKAETTNTSAGFFFKQFNESGGWYPKWCGKTGENLVRKVNHKISDSARYCASGCSWDQNMTVFIAHGSYYTFIVGKNSGSDNNMSILETSFAPDTITSVTRAPSGTILTGQSVTVTVSLKRAKSSQERVFVRWTNDTWVTSNFIEITSFDVTFKGSAVIPPQSTQGATVSYYAFTSNSADTPSHANADYLTLNLNNNSNQNYSYTLPNLTPYIIISNPAEILEHQEDGKLINVKVRNAKFVASLTPASWSLTNLPSGVAKGTVTRLTDSTATIALSGNSTEEYGHDITNLTLTILASEFLTPPSASLSANTGVTLKDVIESTGIWLHMLTSDNFSYTLGENKSYWINAEIGQESWFQSQIGFGKSKTDPTGWTWADASWYENGEGSNKRVHLQIAIPSSAGTGDFYYAARAKGLEADPWHYGNTTEWTNTSTFSPVYKITVNPPELNPYIIISNATDIFEHQEDGKLINVKVRNAKFVAILTSASWTVTNLPSGVTKGTITRLTDSTATIALSGNSSSEYGHDITNVTVTILASEFQTPPTGSLSANSGVILKDVDENYGIWLHMLTTQHFSQVQGQTLTYWINAEVGQQSWNRSQIGYGKSNTDTTGWSWSEATWYQDGDGNNKRIHAQISIPGLKGTGDFYYVARAKGIASDPWHYGNDSVWTNTQVFAPKYKITVNPVITTPYIIISNATDILEFQEDGKLINVKVRNAKFKASLSAGNWAVTNLPAGVTKGTVTRLSDTTATIALSGNSTAEYGHDITNVTVTIQPAEFQAAPLQALSANSGVVLKDVIENTGIWLHLLTYEHFKYNIGENKSFWLNAEIGQQSWNRSQIGYGKSNSDTSGWSWANASWYEDGLGQNKRIHLQISIPQSAGVGDFYYAARARAQESDPWHYGNDTVWTNTGIFAPKYKITVNRGVTVPYIVISNAAEISEHQENGKLINVKVRNDKFKTTLTPSSWAVTNLPAGVTMGAVTRLTDSTATIALSGNSTADYGHDITNVTITIQFSEFITLTAGSLSANSGVVLKDIVENSGIWLHLLNYQNFKHTLGQNVGYWINAEIGQQSWNRSQIGYGKSNTDTTGWSWADASWYEDGLDNNKRIHLQVTIPSSKGTGDFYYVVRARAEAADPWHYGNDTVWTNTDVFAPKYKITVNPVTTTPYILISNAADILEHQENGKLINVKVRNAKFRASLSPENWAVTNLPQGVSMGLVTRLTDSTATIALSGNSSAEYNHDITNVTVTIQPSEFETAPVSALSANNGVTLKDVIENPGIWLHLLTYEHFTYKLGENKSYWINAEIGQQSWARSQIGYGSSKSDTAGWKWSDATWYEDGSGQNKRIHAQIAVPLSAGAGDFYYVVRAKALNSDPWHYGNDTVWTNTETFAPKYFISVLATAGYKISGTVYYPNSSQNIPLDTVKVFLKSFEGATLQSTLSDASGQYMFSDLSAGSYIIDAYINRKTGGINPIDALLVNRNYISTYNFKDYFFRKAADVNIDLKVNPVDALSINRFYIATITGFKAGSWIVEKDTVAISNANVVHSFRILCVGDPNASFNPKAKVKANFSYSAQKSVRNVKYIFINKSENAGFFKWEFSDGDVSYDANPVKIFEKPGDYYVKLTASNSVEEDDSDFIIIQLK